MLRAPVSWGFVKNGCYLCFELVFYSLKGIDKKAILRYHIGEIKLIIMGQSTA